MSDIVTYRGAVRGALEGFVEKTHFKNLIRSDALIEAAAHVASHSEEGIQMHPEVYICADLETFRKQAPDGAIYLIGKDVEAVDAVKRAMKKCSPLTSRDWDIIIEASSASFKYGIFRSSSVATSLSLKTTHFSTGDDSTTPAIYISRIRPSIVELKSTCGQSLTICFSHDEFEIKSLVNYELELTNSILGKVPEGPSKEGTKTFLLKILRHALKGSHGTLICVIDEQWAQSPDSPELLKDCVRFDPPISFTAEVEHLRSNEGATESTCSPISYFDLIRGILSFDGITVFTNDGRLLYYNSFVQTPPSGDARENHGARKRAFNTLCSNMNAPVLAAFYLSHDGNSAFKKV